MRFSVFISVLFLLFIFQTNTFCQEGEDMFIYNYNLYKPNSNWFTIGMGSGYNIKLKHAELALGATYHYQIKKINIVAGYNLSKQGRLLERNYQTLTNFYIGAGYRKETLKRNIEAFIAPTYAYGKTLVSNNQYYAFRTFGVYTALEYTYKIYYDVGIGATLFAAICRNYKVVGLQLHLYFSGAFKTSVKKPNIN